MQQSNIHLTPVSNGSTTLFLPCEFLSRSKFNCTTNHLHLHMGKTRDLGVLLSFFFFCFESFISFLVALEGTTYDLLVFLFHLYIACVFFCAFFFLFSSKRTISSWRCLAPAPCSASPWKPPPTSPSSSFCLLVSF